MYLIKLFIATLSLVFLGGCTSSTLNNSNTSKITDYKPKNVNYTRFYKKYNGYSYDTKSEPMINYKVLAEDAVRNLFKSKKLPNKLIVTDFVDLTTLKNNSSIGYILSNSIKDSLINLHNIKVIESEVSKYFKLSSNGLRLLTRNINKVQSLKYKIDNAVVGTYTYNKKELIIFVKLIDLKTGMIEGSYTNSMLLGEDTLILKSNQTKISD